MLLRQSQPKKHKRLYNWITNTAGSDEHARYFFALYYSLSMSLSIWTSILTEVGQNIDGMWTEVWRVFYTLFGTTRHEIGGFDGRSFLPFFVENVGKSALFAIELEHVNADKWRKYNISYNWLRTIYVHMDVHIDGIIPYIKCPYHRIRYKKKNIYIVEFNIFKDSRAVGWRQG